MKDSTQGAIFFTVMFIVIFIPMFAMVTYPPEDIIENRSYLKTGIITDKYVTVSGLFGNFENTVIHFEDGTVNELKGIDYTIIIGERYSLYKLKGYSNLRIEGSP